LIAKAKRELSEESAKSVAELKQELLAKINQLDQDLEALEANVNTRIEHVLSTFTAAGYIEGEDQTKKKPEELASMPGHRPFSSRMKDIKSRNFNIAEIVGKVQKSNSPKQPATTDTTTTE